MTIRGAGTAAVVLAALAGCASHEVDVKPIEVKPIHLTVDINLKIQRELDDFFDFQDVIDDETTGDTDEETVSKEGDA